MAKTWISTHFIYHPFNLRLIHVVGQRVWSRQTLDAKLVIVDPTSPALVVRFDVIVDAGTVLEEFITLRAVVVLVGAGDNSTRNIGLRFGFVFHTLLRIWGRHRFKMKSLAILRPEFNSNQYFSVELCP